MNTNPYERRRLRRQRLDVDPEKVNTLEKVLEERAKAYDALKYTVNVAARLRMKRIIVRCDQYLEEGLARNALAVNSLRVLDKTKRNTLWRWKGNQYDSIRYRNSERNGGG